MTDIVVTEHRAGRVVDMEVCMEKRPAENRKEVLPASPLLLTRKEKPMCDVRKCSRWFYLIYSAAGEVREVCKFHWGRHCRGYLDLKDPEVFTKRGRRIA